MDICILRKCVWAVGEVGWVVDVAVVEYWRGMQLRKQKHKAGWNVVGGM